MNNESALSRSIDKTTTGQLSLAPGGSLAYANLNEIMEVAKVMAISQVAIPKHLRENPGACLAVAIQAAEWQMSPFSVANKSYCVNDRLAYEAQLVAAVILKRAPIKGRIRYEYSGEGERMKCKVLATLLDDGEVVFYESPEIGKITVKNSPLWKSDPAQQLGYFAVRSMCRRHFPDVLLGVYTPEEMAQETMREVGPSPTFTKEPAALPTSAPVSSSPAVETEPEKPISPATPETPAVGTSGEMEGGGSPPEDADKATLLADLTKRMEKDGVSAKTVKAWAVANAGVASLAILTKDYDIEVLQKIDEEWDSIRG